MPFRFNPLTGKFDLVNTSSGGGGSSPENFSYYQIATGVTVTVPLYQMMVVVDEVLIEGTLVVEGIVAVIN